MYSEIFVDLNSSTVKKSENVKTTDFGKSLAVDRITTSAKPEETIYLSGYTAISASGLGFAGKTNLYGISLLGGNLQGSLCGGLFEKYLTAFGILGVQISGYAKEQKILYIDETGKVELLPLSVLGSDIKGTDDFGKRLFGKFGEDMALALTDPYSVGFDYNAVICNTRHGDTPNHAAGRGTTIFGKNGLLGIAVKKAKVPFKVDMDKQKVQEMLKKIVVAKRNVNLAGDDSKANPLFGGTYGAAAKGRFDGGHGLTNLFRSANVPEEHYDKLLPQTMVLDQIKLADENNIKIDRHSCTPGCPNRCVQFVYVKDENGKVLKFKTGEWETFHGVINLGIFENVIEVSSRILEHSNIYAYDHIEALVTLAALALVSEIKTDTGVRYGDAKSVFSALEQAVEGKTELGKLVRKGAAAVEKHYGIERHFTVGGHSLPFHNGRSHVQTGVGLSWTYGRHGECCSGPGRHNFLGLPYDSANHTLPPETHVMNTMHAMTMYGAVDDCGMCFFIGPNIDTLVDMELIYNAMGMKLTVPEMIKKSAQTILKVYDFNKKRGVNIQPLPKVFYEVGTYGNKQKPEEGLPFNVPFEFVSKYGLEVLKDVASGKVTPPEDLLTKSRARYAQ